MTDLYDKDVYSWALKQADALRRRSANEIDWDNVAEEIEDVARSEAREWRNRMAVLLLHLLKWRFQPQRRGRSWEASIKGQRIALAIHMRDNPSLKAIIEALFTDAYAIARTEAFAETDLDDAVFPDVNPFTLDQATDPAFWPEPPEDAAR
jgi:hypothetical protein